jgi:hypothetical protein
MVFQRPSAKVSSRPLVAPPHEYSSMKEYRSICRSLFCERDSAW